MNILVIKCIIFHLGLLNKLFSVHCLTELPAVGDVGILSTEAAIRHTLNKLFRNLKLKSVRDKPKLTKYSIVHNNLVSITLQDHDNLKNIAKLTRVDSKNITTRTEQFMVTINELLNEDNSVSNDIAHKTITYDIDDNVMILINDFLKKLEELKEKYNVVSHYDRSDINADLLKILVDNDKRTNVSHDLLTTGEYDDVLMENEFWMPSGRRIFRGQRTKIKYFPFMASIQIMNQFHCAGSIIKSDLIISAASCLQLAYNNRFFRENPAFLSARVGSSFFNGAGEKIPVMEVYFHPRYDPKTLRNNLCIMRLLRRLNLRKRRVKKIDIDREPFSLPETTDGITVVGWGPKRSNNILHGSAIDQMSFSVLDFYPLDECQEIYTSQYVTRTNFCAGFFTKGGGACNRDVGGPGIVDGLLQGVISFGSPTCGAENSPTVFMKVGYYADWIDDILSQSVPYRKQRTTTTTPRTLAVTMPRYQVPTKFTVVPIGEKTPIADTPYYDVHALRQLTNQSTNQDTLSEEVDPQLFKDFLKTVFGSKEVQKLEESLAKEDLDIKYENPTEVTRKPAIKTKPNKLKTDYTVAVTKQIKDETHPIAWFDQSSTELVTTEEVSAQSEETVERKYTLMDENLNVDAESEPDKAIGRMNTNNSLKRVTEKYKITSTEYDSDEESEESVEIMLEVPKSSDVMAAAAPSLIGNDKLKAKALAEEAEGEKLLEFMKHVTKPSYTYLNDSVLTLLYLSDSDKKHVGSKLDSGDIRNTPDLDAMDKISSNDEYDDLLSKQDLYEILKETLISEGAKHNNKK